MTHYFCSSLTPLNSDTRILPARGVDIGDVDALEAIAQTLDLTFKTEEGSELVSVFLDGREVSKTLRTEQTGEMASKIATRI
jgi:cytidylate kinase